MTGQVGLEAVPQLRGPRGPVGHERDLPALQNKFRQDKCVKTLPRDGEGGGEGGMGVYDGADIRPPGKNPEM